MVSALRIYLTGNEIRPVVCEGPDGEVNPIVPLASGLVKECMKNGYDLKTAKDILSTLWVNELFDRL